MARWESEALAEMPTGSTPALLRFREESSQLLGILARNWFGSTVGDRRRPEKEHAVDEDFIPPVSSSWVKSLPRISFGLSSHLLPVERSVDCRSLLDKR